MCIYANYQLITSDQTHPSVAALQYQAGLFKHLSFTISREHRRKAIGGRGFSSWFQRLFPAFLCVAALEHGSCSSGGFSIVPVVHTTSAACAASQAPSSYVMNTLLESSVWNLRSISTSSKP